MQQPTYESVDQRKDVPGQYLDIALVPRQYLDIALQWPLICPCKVLHTYIYIYIYIYILHHATYLGKCHKNICHTHHYIKGQYSERQVQQVFRVPKVLHNICNMYGQDLPDMSTLSLGRCAPLSLCIHMRQILLPMLHM